MPDCSETKMVCGKPCTMEGGLAYYKDCNTKRTATGKTYDEARKKTAGCAGLTGETLKQCQAGKSTLFPGVRRIHPTSKIKKTVPAGSRFDDKEKNWIDTEKLLGDPSPDNDPGTVGGSDGDCFGLPMECGSLAVIGGAVLILILVMKFL